MSPTGRDARSLAGGTGIVVSMPPVHVPLIRSTTYAALRALPMSRRDIERQLRAGILIRARRGRYVWVGTPPEAMAAARWGGRLDCVSMLVLLGVFVQTTAALHIQLNPNASRLPLRDGRVCAHWRPTASGADDLVTDLVEALAQACRCQNARAAVATLDSAWHLGLVDESQIAAVFALLPARYGLLRRLLDPRSESGPETLVRLILRSLGCRTEVQVLVAGVGRVDLLVDGWLIVECDSRAFHSSWEAQRNDRRRDSAAAARGFATFRVIAGDVLFHPEDVRAALDGLVQQGRRRRAHSSGSGRPSPRRDPLRRGVA
jgi:very-short-patch-repair endonuclease